MQLFCRWICFVILVIGEKQMNSKTILGMPMPLL